MSELSGTTDNLVSSEKSEETLYLMGKTICDVFRVLSFSGLSEASKVVVLQSCLDAIVSDIDAEIALGGCQPKDFV